MSNERVGERVFGDVDAALADMIVSRAKENSREPADGCAYGVGVNGVNKPQRRRVSILKIAIPAVLILAALWVLIRRRCR